MKLLADYNSKTIRQFLNDREVSKELCRSVAIHCGLSGGGNAVSSFNTRTGDVTLLSSDVITALGYTPSQITSSNNLLIVATNGSGNIIDGSANVITRPLTGFTVGSNATIAATDTILAGFGKAQGQINARAPIASPTFTGTPAAPTAAPGTNTTQIATTAFVNAAVTAHVGTALNIFQASASGDGTTTTFNVPHGVSSPTMVLVTPNSEDAKDISFAQINGANVEIVYANPPITDASPNLFWTILVN